MIALAKANAAMQQRNSPRPKLWIPPLRVIMPMPMLVIAQLSMTLRDGNLRIRTASKMGTMTMAEFSKNAQVDDEVY